MRHRFLCVLLALFVGANAQGQISTPALLDTIQHAAFNFFWTEANPTNGLIKDRSTSGSPSSIASVGFGLSAICIGVDHGWVSRPAARDRVLRTLQTFWRGPQGNGAGCIGNYGLFYHFLDMNTATRTWESELSTIDTGLLLAGIIDAKQYFSAPDAMETAIRAYADSIYARMNWDLMRNFNPGILMGWKPGTGFLNYGQWRGYNEASIMYILAMGSPTYPVGPEAWTFWTMGYQWVNYYGYYHVGFAPLFGHQYSHCWIDYRSISDEYLRAQGITYFENSRRATLAQRAYSIANPGGFPGYSDSLWGITASDVPPSLHEGITYMARGAPPAQDDDGTITPTAPIGSIAFAPEAVLPVIRNMWNNYRSQLWTPYGFRDAFNLKVNWWDTDVIGIDQGPIIIMIENYLNQRVWDRFMKNPDVQRGLQVAGFLPVTDVREQSLPADYILRQNYPNPFNPTTTIAFTLPAGTRQAVSLRVFDILGRLVATLLEEERPGGSYAVTVDAAMLPSGTYYYEMQSGPFRQTRTFIVLK